MFARGPVALSVAALSASVGVAGCGGSDERLVVYAASSLTDAFEQIESEFEAEHVDVDVVISFGGSSSLAAQLVDGAPGQVFATANPEQMQRVVDDQADAPKPVVFAENSMVVAVEAGNPSGIDGVAALADGPVVVLAAPEVPAGDYAARVLDCAGVEVEVASFEPSVRSVATKIALGEADAGIVYRTDIDDRLDAVEIDPACNERAEYPIVPLTDDPHAERFVEFVLGERGRAALVAAGFEVP
jgi:molybdate transport system substrate-binding protein